MTEPHAQLHYRLDLAVARAARSRLARLAAAPFRMTAPVLLRRLHGRVRCVAETFWGGRMYVILPESVSTLVWRYGYFEDDVCRYFLSELDAECVVIDVGAHFGFFTLFASELVGPAGRVISFEPMPRTHAVIAANVRTYAAHQNVTLVHAAASDTTGSVKFNDFGITASAYNSAFDARRGSPVVRPLERVTVATQRADDVAVALGLDRVDLVKVDAESSELLVLRGMARVLTSLRPSVVLEVGDFGLAGATPCAELVEYLTRLGYEPFELQNGRLVPHAPVGRYEYGNLLFRHPSRMQRG